MTEIECRYPCGCEQFPEEHCSCMEGHRHCSRCWAPWHPAGTACVCEMGGCAAPGVGLGDIDGDQFYLCDEHRYPVPGAAPRNATRGRPKRVAK